MKLRNMILAMLSVFTLALAGCGGGGGGGAAAPASTTTVSGVVSKGLVQGAKVRIFSVDQNGAKVLPAIGETPDANPTDANGKYSITVSGAVTGPILVEATGGSYKDEANPSVTKQLSTEFTNQPLRAFLAEATGATGNINVTPLTELAVQKNGVTPMTPANINAANNAIATAFFGAGSAIDIVKTAPANASAAFPAGTSDDQKAYALKLAALSKFQATPANGAALQAAVLTAFLNSINTANDGSLGTVATTYATAASDFLADATANPNGTAVGNIVTGLTLSASPTTTFTGAPGVTLTAKVARAADSAPTGETVSFAVAPSSSASLSAATASTTSGVATVTLTGTALGQVTVTATAGGLTKTATVNFVDPAAPASMTFTSSAPSEFLNGSLTLTANVTQAAGGPVPNGTPVNFAVTSGSGTLSAATTTTGGAATVTLTSAVAGAVTVTATAGTVSQPVTANFIVKPTTVTVKVATSGTLPANRRIGTITASVLFPANKVVSSSAVSAASGVGLPGATPGVNVFFLGTPDPTLVLLLWTDLSNTGITGVGEFATVTFNVSNTITPETIPTAADFSIAPGFIVGDNTANSVTINELSVVIPPNGVTIQ